MATFDANGVSLFYEDKGTGQPLVFVHGTLCDYRGWSAQTTALSPLFRTVAYSRRYAYPNSRQGDLVDSTVENNAADLEALMNGLGLAPAHVVGHSYGGFIATYFATKHPELLNSLTLVNAAVGSMIVRDASPGSALSLLLRYPGIVGSARRFLKATNTTVRAIDAGDLSPATRVFLPALQNGRTDLPQKGELFDKMVVDNARTVKETTSQPPLVTKAETRGIKTPTLVMWGELSAPWDSKISELLSSSIPNCQVARIPGAGHFCLNEKPAEVNLRLADFLKKNG